MTEPGLLTRLEEAIVEALRQEHIENMELSPPEIVDWARIDSFRFHFDGRGLNRPDLRLIDFLSAIRYKGELNNLDPSFLRRHSVAALDADHKVVRRWNVWRCLTAEVELGGVNYILDEGDFFAVAEAYLRDLNNYVSALPDAVVALPSAPKGMRERDYNELAVQSLKTALLLDRRTISVSNSTTPIEICDILTGKRQLIHVKRHLGSRDLSHLFSQGVVSAELLQIEPDFRSSVQRKITEVVGKDSETFAFFDESGIVTSDFEIVYAIIAGWRDRDLVEALPFFSKINLRRAAQDLINRHFKVACKRITYGSNI